MVGALRLLQEVGWRLKEERAGMNEEVSALRLHGAALDSSDAFSLFLEFINTIDTRLKEFGLAGC